MLSNETSLRLSQQVGQTVRSVEGTVLAIRADTMQVDVAWRALYAGTRFEGARDTIDFHRSEILQVDRRELSRTRTALAIGGAIAALVAVISGVSSGGGGSDPDPNGTVPF